MEPNLSLDDLRRKTRFDERARTASVMLNFEKLLSHFSSGRCPLIVYRVRVNWTQFPLFRVFPFPWHFLNAVLLILSGVGHSSDFRLALFPEIILISRFSGKCLTLAGPSEGTTKDTSNTLP